MNASDSPPDEGEPNQPVDSRLAHDQRLRAPTRQPPFQVVLVHPEIPPNTGNVARLCAATGAHLHLIHPLGFSVDEKAVRRAGLDYWHLVRVTQHESWTEFQDTLGERTRLFLFSGKAARSFLDVTYEPGDYLVFGKESSGLPPELLAERAEDLVAIPTLGEVRSLNLANAVALGVYEALRQTGQLKDASLRPIQAR